MTRLEVQAEARKWLRTPYKQRGRGTDGVDCIGFLVMVGRAFGVPHQDTLDYSCWPSQNHLILRILAQYLIRMPAKSSLPGLVGAFAEARLPCHVGIFSEKHGVPHLIHARIVPHYVIEEPWQHMPRSELRLIGLLGFPGLEL
jgi:hypothetical protein